jgi:hypothetical protein
MRMFRGCEAAIGDSEDEVLDLVDDSRISDHGSLSSIKRRLDSPHVTSRLLDRVAILLQPIRGSGLRDPPKFGGRGTMHTLPLFWW